uniref:Uncharacterized protein n=1 Tax=Sinocyclocheilus grahami TaxID=75366 RepID=A0A672NSK9_SINGR
MAPSFGDERCFSAEGAENSSSCQDKRRMDEKISPIEKQLKYLLNKKKNIYIFLSNIYSAHLTPFFTLEESDPLSISHFSIGQCQIDNMKLSISRYCCPTPFLASAIDKQVGHPIIAFGPHEMIGRTFYVLIDFSCSQKSMEWRPRSVMRGVSQLKVRKILHPVRIREGWMKKSLPLKSNLSTC